MKPRLRSVLILLNRLSIISAADGYSRHMLVRFLTAIGYSNDDVMSEDGYDPDLEDFGGRECAVVLAIEEYIPNDPDFDDNDEPIKKRRNVVKGVKKAGAGRGAVGKVGGII